MIAERAARPLEAGRRPGHPPGRHLEQQRPVHRVLHPPEAAPLPPVGLRQHLGGRVHRAEHNDARARIGEHLFQYLIRAEVHRPFFDLVPQQDLVLGLGPLEGGVEAGVLGQLRSSHDPADCLEVRVGVAGDEGVAVLHADEGVGEDGQLVEPRAPPDLPRRVVEQHRVLEVAHERLGPRDVDHLALARRLPPVDGGQHRHARPGSLGIGADPAADADGRAVGIARDVEQAGERLICQVVLAGPPRSVGPELAVR